MRKCLAGVLIIVPLVVFLFTGIASASYWAKTYGGISHDMVYSINKTLDGGCIVAGATYSYGAGDWDAWILKLDGNGNVQWQKTYGSTNYDIARSIQQTSDGGYIVAGGTYSYGAGNWDAWILKLDGNGSVQWQKTYGGSSGDNAYSIQQTSDGGYIVVGSTDSYGTGDVWILKLDASGNVQWQKTYGGASGEYADSIQQTSDGGYILAGLTYSYGAGDCDAWILKLDSNGNVQWQKTYGGGSYDTSSSIEQTSDGGYIVAEHTESFGAGTYDIWILKLDTNGNILWQKTYGGTDYDTSDSIHQTSDGGYIIAGYTQSFGAGDGDFWVLRLNTNGNILWQKTYGGSNYEQTLSFQKAEDNGYLMTGYFFDNGYIDFFVLKLDSNGDIPDCPIIGTSNAAVNDTNATVSDTTVTSINTSVSPQASTAFVINTNATITEICYNLSPTIGYSPTSFSFTATQGGSNPSDQTLNITNTGGGTLNWTVNDDATWLSLNPTSGTNSGTVTLLVNIAGLTAGIYNATIPITAPGATNSPVDISVTLTINAPSQWIKTYGGASGDYANSIQQTSDGGYVVAGFTGSFGDPHGDAWVLKLDGNGNVQWQKTYGGATGDYANSIQQTSDGGYVVAGFTGSFGAGNSDAWVLKLDGNGNVQWQKTYGGTSGDYANSIQQTSDGGYIVAGDNESFGAGNSDAWVLKLDGYGNVQWQKTYGGTDRESAMSIQQTSDDGYIVAGFTESFGAGYIAAWVLKLDGYGNVQWQKTYGFGTWGEFANSIQQTSDGGYVLAGPGEPRYFGGYFDAAWVFKLDGYGNVQWKKTYGGTSFDDAYSIQQTSDGGFVVVGYTDSSGGGYFAAWVLKLDGYGNVQWQKTYGGGTSQDYAESVRQTSDGGFVVAGWTGSFGAGGDAWVLKLDANGDIPGCPIIGTSNAIVNDTGAPVSDTTVTGIDTNISPQTSTATPLNTNATVTGICYSGPQIVTLLSPNGGDVIPSGSTYTIRWTAPQEAVKFTLTYSKDNGTTWNLIANNVTGTSYDWQVPTLLNNKKQCLVKVKAFNSQGAMIGKDKSDSVFTIEVVKLTSPDGGETLTSETPYTITWTTNATKNPVASVKLTYTTNGGTTWTLIDTPTGNSGSYDWTVPNASSSSCKVKVVLKDATGTAVGKDASDGFFTIQ